MVNRLQVRLDEEEFGLAEAPAATATPEGTAVDSPTAADAKSSAPPPAPDADNEDEESPKDNDDNDKTTTKGASVVDPAPTEKKLITPDATDGDGGTKEAGKTSAEPGPGTVVVGKGMSFEEKKKARAARFKIEVVPATKDGGSTERRKRDRGKKGVESGAGAAKDSKKQKAEKPTPNYDSLTKEDLEKRLERAQKYGLTTDNVDAVKAALRKFRFKGK